MYDTLCRRVAGDGEILALLADVPATQPTANVLFAAVHYLLLGGAVSPLAGHYPTVTGSVVTPDGDPWPLFKAFCLEHAPEIRHLTATRTVQTNEVRRSAMLMPAIATASAGRPIALVELGAAAGLNLRFDRYRYRYAGVGAGDTGDQRSPLLLRTTPRGSLMPPIPQKVPDVRWRRGIDLHPIDAADPDGVRWAAALLWPNQVERLERLRTAMGIARAVPVDIVEGDAVTLAAVNAADAPGDLHLIVMHSFMLNQIDAQGRESLDQALARLSRVRAVDRLSMEWLRPDEGPMLRMTRYRDGEAVTVTLAAVHHHGEWIEWLDQSSGNPLTTSIT